MLTLINPFDYVDFAGADGEAVQSLLERVSAGLDGQGGTVPFEQIRSTMENSLEEVDVPDSGQVAEVSFHLAAYAGISAGANVASASLVNFSGGFAFSWSLIDSYWEVSRGLELELAGSVELGAEEFIRFYRDSETVVAGFSISAEAGVSVPPLSFGPKIFVHGGFTADIDAGKQWTYSAEQAFSRSEFLQATRQSTLTEAVLDVFTPYGDHWWEKAPSMLPISIDTGLDLLGLADFNNSPIQLLNDGDGIPDVSLKQSQSDSMGLGISIGIGVEAGVGLSAGVAATFGVELSRPISVPGHDPLSEPNLDAAINGIPYSAHVEAPDGSISDAANLPFGMTHADTISPAGYVDWYAFELTSRDTIGATFHESGGLDAQLMLYDASGSRLAWSHGGFTTDLLRRRLQDIQFRRLRGAGALARRWCRRLRAAG